MTDIVEQIAQRWYECEPSTHPAPWASQPDSVKEVFRAMARQFWANPGKLRRELQSVAIHARQMTTAIERSTKAWA